MHTRTRTTVILFILSPVAACSDGLLSAVDVSTPCAPGDATCQESPILPLAVGATTTINAAVAPDPGGEAISTHLRVVDDNIASIFDGEVLAVDEGVTAVLIQADDDSVLDFTHISTAFPERISLHRGFVPSVDERDLPAAVQVAAGGALQLTLFVQSDSQVLGGNAGDTWFVDDDSFAIFAEPGRATVTVPASGSANVHVNALGFEQILRVEVVQ